MVTGRDSLGSRLRALRRQAGLSQVELARAVGRHQTAIGPYERDEYSPSREIVSKFAQLLDTTPEFLIFGREPNHASLTVRGAIGAGGLVGEPPARQNSTWIEIKESQLVAYRVDNDCMRPVYLPGSFILVARAAEIDLQQCYGKDGLAELGDGRLLLRRLMPGRSDRLHNLLTHQGEAVYDVNCQCFFPVLGVLSSAAVGVVGKEVN